MGRPGWTIETRGRERQQQALRRQEADCRGARDRRDSLGFEGARRMPDPHPGPASGEGGEHDEEARRSADSCARRRRGASRGESRGHVRGAPRLAVASAREGAQMHVGWRARQRAHGQPDLLLRDRPRDRGHGAAPGLGEDLLLANEVLDASRLGRSARRGARVTVAVDSEETIDAARARRRRRGPDRRERRTCRAVAVRRSRGGSRCQGPTARARVFAA